MSREIESCLKFKHKPGKRVGGVRPKGCPWRDYDKAVFRAKSQEELDEAEHLQDMRRRNFIEQIRGRGKRR